MSSNYKSGEGQLNGHKTGNMKNGSISSTNLRAGDYKKGAVQRGIVGGSKAWQRAEHELQFNRQKESRS